MIKEVTWTSGIEKRSISLHKTSQINADIMNCILKIQFSVNLFSNETIPIDSIFINIELTQSRIYTYGIDKTEDHISCCGQVIYPLRPNKFIFLRAFYRNPLDYADYIAYEPLVYLTNFLTKNILVVPYITNYFSLPTLKPLKQHKIFLKKVTKMMSHNYLRKDLIYSDKNFKEFILHAHESHSTIIINNLDHWFLFKDKFIEFVNDHTNIQLLYIQPGRRK